MVKESEIIILPISRMRPHKPTTAERLHDSVLRHRIAWTDLAARVVENEGIPKQEADAQVAALIERRACSMAVAIALIDMIVDGRR